MAGQTGSGLGNFLLRIWGSVTTAHFALRGMPNPRFSVQFGCSVSDFLRVILYLILDYSGKRPWIGGSEKDPIS